MNDDELADRLRATLRDEASTVHEAPDAWERFQERTAHAPHAPDRRRWLLAAPVAAVAVAAAVIAVVVVNSGPSRGRKTEVATATTAASAVTSAGASSPTTAAASASATGPAVTSAGAGRPAGGPVPAGFHPTSVTFVSANEGFVLGSAPCASAPCTSLLRTVDGGRTWVGVPAPRSANVSEVRFANGVDGWAWGPELWVTHDGALTWHQLTVPGADGRVYDLEAAAGTVHMAVFEGRSFEVATAAVRSDVFTLSSVAASVLVGGGPVPTVQLVLQGSTGWMIEVDRTVVGGLRLVNGVWQQWTPPCFDANGTAVLAASSATELVAACDQGVWGPATPMGERLWVSHDGGSTWTDVGPVPVVPHAEVVASSGGAVAVAGAPEGAGGEQVMTTFDGGRSWTYAVRVNTVMSARDLGFTTTSQGVVVLTESGQPGQLWMTRDGGHTWAEVRFP